MNKFLILPNTKKEDAITFGKEMMDFLHTIPDASVVTTPEEADCIITLGGDGTIIKICRDYAKYQLPVLGVNLGTLGFLAEIVPADFKQAIHRLLQNDFMVEERMMIEGKVIRQGKTIYQNQGFNDIVLHSTGHSRAITYQMFVNGEALASYTADGLILSTPTGSTAYNLSAGGPIMMPHGDMIVATPINPHTFVNRAMVFPSDVTISFELSGKEEDEAVISFDGDEFPNLLFDDVVEVKKSMEKVRLIKFEKDSFIEVLRKKLKG